MANLALVFPFRHFNSPASQDCPIVRSDVERCLACLKIRQLADNQESPARARTFRGKKVSRASVSLR